MITRRDFALIFTSIVCCVVGQLLLKTGMNMMGQLTPWDFLSKEVFLKAATNFYIVGGFLIYFVSLCVWLVVLTRVDLSVAYPMLGLNYVLILFFSWLILHENVSAIRWGGVALVFIGVVLIGRDRGKPRTT